MKRALQFLFLAIGLFMLPSILFASHIVGGEMFYKYLGNNQYQVTVKVYRDCYNGLAPYDNPTNVFIFDVNGNLAYTLPITFPGSDTLDNNPGNPCLIVPPNICVEEAIFVYNVTLPENPGGYSILYQRCCRNLLIQNILDPSNTGATYLATIPDPSIVTGNSSPYFNNFPPTLICVNTPFVFDHSATDPDGDSLVYHLCAPFVGADAFNPYPNPPLPPPYNYVTYTGGYTANNPMGGNPPMAIDPVTGQLTVTPNTTGNFVVGVSVTEYRNGDSISIHKRDFQFNVVECQSSVVADIPPVINNCSAYQVCFENNSVGGTTYHWDFGTGNSSDTSNLQYPCFTYSDTGIYVVTFYINPGTVCGDTVTTTVYIYPTLIAKMSAPDGCQGIPVNFGDQSTSQFGTINSWDWNFGNGGSSTQQNPSYTYTNPGTYTVTLIVENDLGCIDTVQEQIVINPSPTTEVSPNDTTICYLDVVNLFASGTGTFVWQPNYNLSNPNINNPVAGPDVTTTYTVTVTNSFGCYAKDSITITVFDTIIADAGPDVVLCPGESTQLNGSGGLNYSWSGQGLSNPNISNPIATPSSTTTYVLTVSAGSCIGTDAVTVYVKPFPNIAAGEDKTICEGDSVEISASGGTEYDWIPTNTLTDPTIANPIAFPSATTTYTVTATDSNSCNKLVTDDVTVFVIERPDLVITQDTSIILGTSIEISADYYGSDCQWVPSTGLADPNSCTTIASPTESTTYYVYFTYNGCVFVDSVHIGVILDPIVKFPNAFSPNGDGQNDYFRPVILGLATIDAFRVFNRWGQLLYELTNVSLASGTLPANWGWDGNFNGKPQELAVFVYSLVGKGTATGTPIELKGNFTLVR